MAQAARQQVVRLAAVAAFLAVLLGGFILYLAWPRIAGTTVVLATVPADPFDLLRGQHLVIAYEIGTLPAVFTDREGEGAWAEVGDTVYVSVAPDPRGIWHHRATSLAPPADGVFLRGEVVRRWDARMQVRYGIEQYFVQRGSELPNRGLDVEVKVDRSGRARIVRLLHDGEPVAALATGVAAGVGAARAAGSGSRRSVALSRRAAAASS